MNPLKHVAIIMDGNGRWGIKHKGSRNAGHRAGLNTVEMVINQCIAAKISFLTLYTFSTENWKRPKKEINFLFGLLETFLSKKIQKLIEKKIKIKFIGDKKKLPIKLIELLKLSEIKTKKFNKLQVNIALNYGSRNEILNSIKSIIKTKKTITKKNIEDYLYTRKIPDPELLIRTGDTKRLSNFLLWQLAYTEIFFEKKLWPDFKDYDFKKILNKFSILKRNFGSI
jgi:undecaprenyl diphosphate synthase